MTADHLLSANLVGRMWREAILLSFAFDYESATKHRKRPTLCA
jgi:Asp-tRNA(Asn)/Glu-tRNA(Gln) amidotransferase A subunit family amidase